MWARWCCYLAWWLVVLPAYSSQSFLPINLSHAFPDGFPTGGSGPGLSWADVDQDGRLDLFLFGGGAWLYHNNGNWSFSDITATAFAGSPLPNFYNGHGQWADFNHDGFPDLLVWGFFAMLNPFVALLRNNQGNNFTEVTNEALPALTPCHNNGCMMEWGDFDGDNRVDLFVAVAGGTKTVCLNNGNELSTFTEVDVSATFGVAPIEGAVRAGDFDGDGKDDLVWVRPAISGVYRSNGDGTFTDETERIFAEDSTPLHPLQQSSADWGDANGDQRLDLVVCGLAAGPPKFAFSAVFLQTEEGQFRMAPQSCFRAECCHKFGLVRCVLWIMMVMPFSTWPSLVGTPQGPIPLEHC